jgi:hypothetical protein
MFRGWTTWDNRTIPTEEITHQHLSNIYYYTHFVLPEYYDEKTKKEVYQLLMEKFGRILPYSPDILFVQEQGYPMRKGFLRDNNDIVIEGKKVGVYGL